MLALREKVRGKDQEEEGDRRGDIRRAARGRQRQQPRGMVERQQGEPGDQSDGDDFRLEAEKRADRHRRHVEQHGGGRIDLLDVAIQARAVEHPFGGGDEPGDVAIERGERLLEQGGGDDRHHRPPAVQRGG